MVSISQLEYLATRGRVPESDGREGRCHESCVVRECDCMNILRALLGVSYNALTPTSCRHANPCLACCDHGVVWSRARDIPCLACCGNPGDCINLHDFDQFLVFLFAAVEIQIAKRSRKLAPVNAVIVVVFDEMLKPPSRFLR